MKYIYTFAFLTILPCMAFAGGGIGGGGLGVDVPHETLMMLKSGALDGDLIRLTKPGSDPVYLQPDLASITGSSITAKTLPSGNTTVFYVALRTDNAQSKLVLNMARNLKAMSGMLPLLPQDVIQKPKLKIETVNVEDIDAETMKKISAPVELDEK